MRIPQLQIKSQWSIKTKCIVKEYDSFPEIIKAGNYEKVFEAV